MDNQQLELIQPYCENDMRLLKRIAQSIFTRLNESLTEADYDDFYSIANLVLWQCSKIYNPSINGNFGGFLYSCLQKKFRSEIRDRHRNKRVINLMSESLDTVIKDESNTRLIDLVASDFDTFEEVIKEQETKQYTDKVQLYISRLSNQQVNILNMLVDGYKPAEIRKELNISTKEYTDNIQYMRAYENVKYLF